MKKIVALITLIVCCFSLFACQGDNGVISYDGTEGLDFYHLPDGTYGVKAGTALYLEEIVIPAEYKGNKVTVISKEAFCGADNLISISLPATITVIDYRAFIGCKFTTIELPSSLTTIGQWAFSTCSNLTSITVPDSVTTIGMGAFEHCTSLTSITIGNSVTSIGDDPFLNCTSLTIINFAGTTEQWNQISKDSDWNIDSVALTVNCTNGSISVPKNETQWGPIF